MSRRQRFNGQSATFRRIPKLRCASSLPNQILQTGVKYRRPELVLAVFWQHLGGVLTEQQPYRVPTTAEVGQYYDFLGDFYRVLWGDSIHFGYWPDPGERIVVADFGTIRPIAQAEMDLAYPAFAVSEIGSLEGYISDLKSAGLTNSTCRDVTANTIKPSNRAPLANLQSDRHLAELRTVYGEERVAGFLGGWDAETLTYVVLAADRP